MTWTNVCYSGGIYFHELMNMKLGTASGKVKQRCFTSHDFTLITSLLVLKSPASKPSNWMSKRNEHNSEKKKNLLVRLNVIATKRDR